MELVRVDQRKCSRDGICAAVCPMRLIELKDGGFPSPIDGAGDLCINCGHCLAACPQGCLIHREIAMADCPPVRQDLILTPEHCEHFLRNRRSIRNYRDKPVPRSEIERLIRVARHAPSGHNSQCAEWLVLDNRDELRKLAGIVADWMEWMLANLREMALSFHMDRTLLRWNRGEDVILRGTPALIVTHAAEANRLAPSTCTIALTYLELAATSMGLGSCWAGWFNAAASTFPPMKEALALPAGHLSFGAMMLGYPEYAYHRLPARKDPPITWR